MKSYFAKLLSLFFALSFAVGNIQAAEKIPEKATSKVDAVTAAAATSTTENMISDKVRSEKTVETKKEAATEATSTAVKPATSSNDSFIPTTKISEDLSVSFPADI